MSLELEWPWIWLMLPLPVLVYRWLPKANTAPRTGVRLPLYEKLSPLTTHPGQKQLKRTKLVGIILLWLLLLSSASRPVSVGEAVTIPALARDLMLAIDLSGSMQTRDMEISGNQVDRLQVVKQVIQPFIDRRSGDRIGLILFGSQAYLQSPLTFDLRSVRILLGEAQIAMAGRETSIGDAIGLAVKRLRDRPASSRVLILVTDGANTAGEIPPLQAAKLAKQEQVRIYTIGVGAEEMVQPGLFGSSFGARRVNPSADLDEKTLRDISALTGGEYFRARNPDELENIYQKLDALEPVEQQAETVRPKQSLYYFPLLAAMVLCLSWWLFKLLQRPLRSWQISSQWFRKPSP
ncbi:VWA domain-containing protein [Aestuariirhabdus sp. Z084]|uniref:vWA domain-containing protein n=1 Tax=Aestuariirhabdus haliotis TaxID=2918751 RepID=UPI00201B4559|nr:VWA domain-containing protein [Aestuariirhabdus haliotis]MCL6414616.1 VWA domain-containing protein [Aestuariirhabdus haliotis]MCL6418402.1 VWA domain-containing protein [Aestuariirhabdus haliotis]